MSRAAEVSIALGRRRRNRSPGAVQGQLAATLSAATLSATGVTFSPLDLANLKFWSVADAANVTKDGSDNVSQWTDLSGLNQHFTNAGAGKPLFVASSNVESRAAIRFNGTSQLLTSSAVIGNYVTTTTWCIWIVFVANTIVTNDAAPYNNEGPLGHGYIAFNLRTGGTFAPTGMAYTFTSAADHADVAVATATPMLLRGRHVAGATLKCRRDFGTEASVSSGTTGTSLASGNFKLGQMSGPDHFHNCDIREMIIASVTPDDATLALVDGYLAANYAFL